MSLVLVIDDEPDFCRMVRRLLEAEGHEVVEATGGDDGIQKFRSLSPELIVVDIFMPRKTGIETILQIRAESPSVRIIAVSGGGGMATADFLQTAKSAGADETLAKPFRAEQLIEAIDKA